MTRGPAVFGWLVALAVTAAAARAEDWPGFRGPTGMGHSGEKGLPVKWSDKDNVAWKTVIYVLVSMFIHYLERLVDFWRETGGLIAGNRRLFAEIVWPHFWAIQLILVVLILMYCTMHELARVIGRDKVLEIFFGTRPKARG